MKPSFKWREKEEPLTLSPSSVVGKREGAREGLQGACVPGAPAVAPGAECARSLDTCPTPSWCPATSPEPSCSGGRRLGALGDGEGPSSCKPFQFFLGGIGFDPQNIIVSGFFNHFLQLVSRPMPVWGTWKERAAVCSSGSCRSSASH